MAVDLRTRAVVAPDVHEALLDVVAEGAPDQLPLGWDGTLGRDDHGFGATLDRVVADTEGPVSLVDVRSVDVGSTLGLVAPEPNAAVVAARAAEYAAVAVEVPTLLTAVSPDGGDEAAALERGRKLLAEAAADAGLDPDGYAAEVVVADDVEAALGDALAGFETVCVGLSNHPEGDPLAHGDVTARVAADAPGTVALVRGP